MFPSFKQSIFLLLCFNHSSVSQGRSVKARVESKLTTQNLFKATLISFRNQSTKFRSNLLQSSPLEAENIKDITLKKNILLDRHFSETYTFSRS